MDKLWTEVVEEQEVTSFKAEVLKTKPQLTITLCHVGLLQTKTEKSTVIKNSWGTGNKYGGEEVYFRSKTISVLVHEDGERMLK